MSTYRTLMAAAGSLLLLGLGVWLHERKGQRLTVFRETEQHQPA